MATCYWMLLVTVVTLMNILPSQTSSTNKCIVSYKSGQKPPNELLMKALYVTDPDPATGTLYSSSGNIFESTITYKAWLAKEHNARDEMQHFWTYMTNLITTKRGVLEIHTHYFHVVDSKYKNNPYKQAGILQFRKFYTLFNDVCTKYSTHANTWPFNCLDKSFFCAFRQVFGKNLEDIVLTSSTNMKDKYDIQNLSNIGVDIEPRGKSLESLFHSDLLLYIPKHLQTDVFYHSNAMTLPLKEFFAGRNRFNRFLASTSSYSDNVPAFKSFVEARCRSLAGSLIATVYYCKAKVFLNKLIACRKKPFDSRFRDPCVYDPVIQEYYERAEFSSLDAMSNVDSALNITSTNLEKIEEFASSTSSQTNDLKAFQKAVSGYLNVKDDDCQLGWPKAFSCNNNAKCDDNMKIMSNLDCHGGHRCHFQTLYRFDCVLKFAMKPVNTLIKLLNNRKSWTSAEVKRAKEDIIITLSYPPLTHFHIKEYSTVEANQLISSTVETVKDYVRQDDRKSLATLAYNLPPPTFVSLADKSLSCKEPLIDERFLVYCNLEVLLNVVFLYIDAYKVNANTTSRMINPRVAHTTIIEQLQLERIQNKIIMSNRDGSDKVNQEISHSRQTLSSFFSSTANYDLEIALGDIGYIDARLTLFAERIDALSSAVQDDFSVVLNYAIATNVAEVAGNVAQMGIAIAQIANPVAAILGGSSVMDLFGSINDMAVTVGTSAQIARIGLHELPRLLKMGQKLGAAFVSNRNQLKLVKDLVDGIPTKNPNIDGLTTQFLTSYNNYDPKVLSEDITAYGSSWETVAGAACDISYSGGTAPSALAAIGLTTKGQCYNIETKIEQLITIYEELYDYQFDLMDSLADAIRSYIRYTKSKDMTKTFNSRSSTASTSYLSTVATMAYMLSTVHVKEVVNQYCDYLTYTEGGVVPTTCRVALVDPSPMAIIKLVGYKPKGSCKLNTVEDYRNIPTKPARAGDTAFIDLTKLYNGESVKFKIPNFQWLRDNGWVGSRESATALFVNQFELFLPPLSMQSTEQIHLSVTPSEGNYLKPGATKYSISLDGYTTGYKEKHGSCGRRRSNEIDNPYSQCSAPKDLVKLCITSEGTVVDREIHPSIFNTWRIMATRLPRNIVPPNPKTNLQLKAYISMCTMPLGRKKRSVNNVAVNRNKRGLLQCCSASNKYWNGSSCTSCPAGSSQKFFGLYCQ